MYIWIKSTVQIFKVPEYVKVQIFEVPQYGNVVYKPTTSNDACKKRGYL